MKTGIHTNLRNWITRLNEQPGVYLIQRIDNGSTYVGSAKHSLQQRLSQHLADLIAGEHDIPLLQDDWNTLGCNQFMWMAKYASSALDARRSEMWLIRLAHALEDHGGYNRRTSINCISASLRATERNYMSAGIRKYSLLPTIQLHERIHPTMIRTFCQGSLPLNATKNFDLDLTEVERLRQLEGWKATAIHFGPERGGGNELCGQHTAT